MPEGELLPDLRKILRKFNPGAVYFQGDADTCFIFEFSLEAVKLAKALPPGCTLRLPAAFRSQCPMASMMSDKS